MDCYPRKVLISVWCFVEAFLLQCSESLCWTNFVNIFKIIKKNLIGEKKQKKLYCMCTCSEYEIITPFTSTPFKFGELRKKEGNKFVSQRQIFAFHRN